MYTAPLHKRRKRVASHLSKDLRKQLKRRSLPVRKGDEVTIMRGAYAGKTGKISDVDLNSYKVYIEGITRKRTICTEVQVPIDPSNLKITDLNLDDEFRRKMLQRKSGVKVEKPKEEVKEEEVSKKDVAPKKTVGTKVLENTEEGKQVGSQS